MAFPCLPPVISGMDKNKGFNHWKNLKQAGMRNLKIYGAKSSFYPEFSQNQQENKRFYCPKTCLGGK